MVAASSLVYDSVQKLFRQIACCKSCRDAQVKAFIPKERKHDRRSYGAKLSTVPFSRYARARFSSTAAGRYRKLAPYSQRPNEYKLFKRELSLKEAFELFSVEPESITSCSTS